MFCKDIWEIVIYLEENFKDLEKSEFVERRVW